MSLSPRRSISSTSMTRFEWFPATSAFYRVSAHSSVAIRFPARDSTPSTTAEVTPLPCPLEYPIAAFFSCYRPLKRRERKGKREKKKKKRKEGRKERKRKELAIRSAVCTIPPCCRYRGGTNTLASPILGPCYQRAC